MNQKGFIMPFITIILIIAAGIGGYFLSQQEKMNALGPEKESTITNLNLQEKCAKQAEKAYNNSGFKTGGNEISGFINHYNPKLNKCFVLMSNNSYDSGDGSIYTSLYDAYEGKLYAEYFRKLSTVKPFVCTMLDKFCHGDEEFNTFVNIYMEK